MRILRSIYRFLLFLIVSWTVYNTFIYLALPLLPFSDSEYAKSYIFDFWNVYLLGALNFSEFVSLITFTFSGWTRAPRHEMWYFLLYLLSVNGLTAYIWCNYQTLLSACFLSLTPCVAGPFPSLLFCDYRILICGTIAIPVFYVILNILNNYRKKRFPHLSLPIWLEWRLPNMVPPKKPITVMIADEFHKFIF